MACIALNELQFSFKLSYDEATEECRLEIKSFALQGLKHLLKEIL